jgi:hypothetical protein
MSIGAHVLLAGWYELQPDASKELKVVNEALAAHDLPPYLEPSTAPELYTLIDRAHCFGRSEQDSTSASSLAALGASGKASGKPLNALSALYTYPIYLLPIDFREPILLRSRFPLFLCSSQQICRDLLSLAPSLGIDLQDGSLLDETAKAINNGDVGEDDMPFDWLFLFEAARLSAKHSCAIVIA